MPGHTTLWPPACYVTALRNNAIALQKHGFDLIADELEGAARLIYRYMEWEKTVKMHDDPTQPFGGNDSYRVEQKSRDVQNKLVMPDMGGTGERMMKWFSGLHLPEELKEIVYEYRSLARKIIETIPVGPERTVALRKLVESKDCAVRAIIEGKEKTDGA